MAGVLKVVTTPIGNLGDMPPRATDALKNVSVILAEDTRHSLKLLNYFGIAGPRLLSCNQQNELDRVPVALERLQANENIALITDAGAPGISDPGGRLIDAVAKAGFQIEVFPGASAVIAALMGSGLNVNRFAFLGFLPKSKSEREKILKQTAAAGLAIVIYEAPSRVLKTLSDLHTAVGSQRVVVAREITKQYETFHRGILGESLSPALKEQGEMVVVVEIDPRNIPKIDADRESKTPKDLAKRLARELGISTREAYQLLAKRSE